VLRGSMRTDLKEAGYHLLKTHGAGADISSFDWQRYLMQMLNLGILEIAYDENFALKITAYGRDILFGKAKARLTVLPLLIRKGSSIYGTQSSQGNEEDELFEQLKKVRRKFSVEEDVSPYNIFSDATLLEMAKEKPLTEQEMLLISGVGERKFDRYGDDFLDMINSYTARKTRVKR
jgi:ATP-dependent DNA helicase RecQ